MKPEQFKQIETLFHRALELPADHRQAFLDEACKDATLRGRVAELLELDSRGGDLDTLRKEFSGPRSGDVSGSYEPGDRIGPFRLVRSIGEGGMGIVFEAEQLEPVRRHVALKLIKWGMDTEQVVARFDAERQALALMNHACIARVYEAGATESGRPYFAMELVEGRPITQHCDAQRLDTRARLELFMNICDGVQHAHRKGIIHRDLKPSNILVDAGNDACVPKIIDFGIAKAVERPLTEHLPETRLGQMLGTPEYLSPEQAAGSVTDVDTRTDVYALGVVLYEMLVGTLPFETDATRRASLDELRRRIREEQPSRPSTKFDTLGPGSAEVAQRRRTDAPALRRQLRGDLDWIVMKALEKEPDRRYQTASELAADIGRHLRHEPVLAGPPDLAYRARRFVRRNRTLVAGLAGIGLALVAGIVAASWFAVGQSRARAEAERQSEISKAVLGFLLKDVLGAANPENIPDRELTVREALDVAAATLDERLQAQPGLSGSIHSAIGLAYSSLGEYETAERHLRAAIERFRIEPGGEHLDTAKAVGNLGELYRRQGRLAQAEPLLVEALEQKRRLMPEEDESLSLSINNLGLMYRDMGRPAHAEPLLVESLELARRHEGPDSLATLIGVHNLALVYADLDRRDDALELLSANLDSWKRVVGETHPHTLQATHVLAVTLDEAGRLDESVAIFNELLEQRGELLGQEHPGTLRTAGRLAAGLARQGRLDEAMRLFDSTIASARRVIPDHWDLQMMMAGRGDCLRRLGRFDEAEPVLVDSLDWLEREFGPDDRRVARVIDQLVALYEDWQRPEAAARWRERR